MQRVFFMRYVVFKCCQRLAGALEGKGVGIKSACKDVYKGCLFKMLIIPFVTHSSYL